MGVPLSTASSKYIKSKNAESEEEVAATKTQLSVLLLCCTSMAFEDL
jgi:hypothetical protein